MLVVLFFAIWAGALAVFFIGAKGSWDDESFRD